MAKGGAPIVFVGTRKDQLPDPVAHGRISATLETKFSSHPMWPYVEHNERGRTGSRRITTRLAFFAVNNVAVGDPVVRELLDVLQRVLLAQEYIKRKVPLSWLRLHGVMFKDDTRSSLPSRRPSS